MTHEHVADGVLQHRVVRGQDRPARIAEDVGDALAHEALPENRSARERDHDALRSPVTAPVAAEDTRRAYLASTPEPYRGAGGCQRRRRSVRSARSTSTSSRRVST